MIALYDANRLSWMATGLPSSTLSQCALFRRTPLANFSQKIRIYPRALVCLLLLDDSSFKERLFWPQLRVLVQLAVMAHPNFNPRQLNWR